MKFKKFICANNAQNYFKDGIEVVYPSPERALRLAILPAYDPAKPDDPLASVPAVTDGEESDFYCMVKAAKWVGHGNNNAKVSFLSPKTFDLDAEDPYEAFYNFCSHSDEWSYLTRDDKKKRLSGGVEHAIFPSQRNFFAANVMDVDAGSRGGVLMAELSESAAKTILYSMSKNGSRRDGIAFERGEDGKLLFGDITDPRGALVLEIVLTGKGYVARHAIRTDGCVMRTKIPDVLLRHRQHMENPESFLAHPGSSQDIVNRIADLLRGYRSPDGRHELEALQEAMDLTYGKGRFKVSERAEAAKARTPPPEFEKSAVETATAKPEEKAEAVDAAVERGVEREKYEREPEAPGEDIDPSDISSIRAMLRGGK